MLILPLSGGWEEYTCHLARGISVVKAGEGSKIHEHNAQARSHTRPESNLVFAQKEQGVLGPT